MKNVLVVGSLNADLVIYTNKIPKLGETIKGEKFEINCGGKGANQAIAVSKLGGNVKMLGCVGNDANGEMLLNHCKSYGVDVSAVKKCNCNTGVAVITVSNGDNSIILDSGANNLVTKDLIDSNIELFKWADYCLFQFEIPVDTVLYGAKLAKSLGKTVIINPAPMCEFPDELLKYTDIITPNETECSLMLGKEVTDYKKATKEIVNMGVKTVIVTLGSKGSVYNDGEIIKTRDVVKSKVVDTTAAGDTFVAAVINSLAQGKNINEAVDFATYASSITVSRHGASKSIPDYDEVTKYIKEML